MTTGTALPGPALPVPGPAVPGPAVPGPAVPRPGPERASPADLAPRTGFAPAFSAIYAGQLARARVARVPLLFVAALQSLGILLLLRGVVAPASGGSGDVTADVTRQSVVAGSTVLVVAFVALNLLAQRFGALRSSGALDHYAALPVPSAAVVLGTASSYATFTVPGAVVTAVVGSLLYDLPLGRLWVLVPVLALAGASLAGLGAVIGLLAPRPELATVAGQLGMSLVIFVGVIPRDRLPAVVQGLRAVVPASYAVDALAETFRPAVRWGLVLLDLGICAVVALLSLALAAWAFDRVVRGRWGRLGRVRQSSGSLPAWTGRPAARRRQ